MCFGFQRDDTLDVFYFEIITGCLIFGCKLFYHGTLCKSHIVLIGRQYLARILFGGTLNHGKERGFFFFTVNDKCATEYLMPTVFRIDLCKPEYFAVGEGSSVLLFYGVQVRHLFWRECQSLLLVILFQIFNQLDRLWLVIHLKNVLSQSVVHSLQHRVMFRLF